MIYREDGKLEAQSSMQMKLKCGAQRHHYSMFNVGRSTCPQCLDSGVSSIQAFYLNANVSTNQMHCAGRRVFDVNSFSVYLPQSPDVKIS